MTAADIIALAGILITMTALIIETRMTRLALYTQVIMDLNREFSSLRLIKCRESMAKKMLSAKPTVPCNELSEILDFFTDVAILADRKAIDRRLAYDMFSYWMIYYWEIAQATVASARETDPESWLVLERLVKHLSKSQKIVVSPKTIHNFLEEEAHLASR